MNIGVVEDLLAANPNTFAVVQVDGERLSTRPGKVD